LSSGSSGRGRWFSIRRNRATASLNSVRYASAEMTGYFLALCARAECPAAASTATRRSHTGKRENRGKAKRIASLTILIG